MHRLITEVGWPVLALCLLLAGASIPTLIRWWRFEVELSQRANRYNERVEAARDPRVRW